MTVSFQKSIIQRDGKRSILGVSLSLSEAEVHWRAFLEGLVKRGLHGVQLIISDDHLGLEAARKAVFSGVPWQHCQFHLQQNVQAFAPRQTMCYEVAADSRNMFNAADKAAVTQYLQAAMGKYALIAPRLSAWLEENSAEGFTVFDFPPGHRRSIRTSERFNRGISRRNA